MRLALLLVVALRGAFAIAGDAGDWPQWRGPSWNGIARGEAPLRWSDTDHIKWRSDIPGRGHSSPVIWGDRIFVTTSVPTGESAPADPAQASAPPQGRRGGFGRG